MSEWMEYIYAEPGLMKMRWMHHQRSIRQGTRGIAMIHDVVCHAHNVMLPHEQDVDSSLLYILLLPCGAGRGAV